MLILKTLKIVFQELNSNKLRSALASLGVVIGIASVIIVYSAGEGISSLVLGQVESFGTNVIQTEIKLPSTKKGWEAEREMGASMAAGIQVTTLNLDDLEDINKISNVTEGYAALTGQEQINYRNEIHKAFLWGVSPAYINIDKAEIDYGRFFTEQEDKTLSQVAVLGLKIKQKLFGESDPIGKFIKIRKTKYRVIGVLKEKGSAFTYDFDEMVYLPIQTMQKKILGIKHVLYMVHEIEDLSQVQVTADQIRRVLRENHDIAPPTQDEIQYLFAGSSAQSGSRDDFRVTTMSEMMDALNTITGGLTLLLLAIVAISLVVGGVGIMNIMYLIVSERAPEIGLRKAVGARNRDITSQFLLESILLTTLGGIIGVVFGIAISYLIAIGAQNTGLDWRLSIPAKAFFVSLSFAFFFGIVFGVYPAKRASALDPIEALRRE